MVKMALDLNKRGRIQLAYDALKWLYGYKIADPEFDPEELEAMIEEVEQTAKRFNIDLEE